AGMATEEFARAFDENAGQAISAFIAGLGDIEASGQSVQPILEELGMTDQRIGDALRRASSASEIFTTAMEAGNQAYRENNALTNEAALRYETVAAKLAIARNEITDAAISFGDVLMPAIAAGAESLADFAGWLSDLPAPMQEFVVKAGAAAAGVTLLSGGFLLAMPRIVATQ